MPQIEFSHVTVTHQHRGKTISALLDASFVIPDASLSVIVGPSGCGKTTLLRTITGFQDYDGDIFLDGTDIENIAIKERGISYIPQKHILFPHMTIYDNIAFPLRTGQNSYEDVNKRVNDVAKELGISLLLTRKPRQLSEGQIQKVALAKAMVNYSRLYLFDEPTSNLDETSKKEIQNLIRKVKRELDATFLVVTHDQHEAAYLADYLIVMNEGRIEQCGTPYEIATKPASIFVRSFLLDPSLEWRKDND